MRGPKQQILVQESTKRMNKRNCDTASVLQAFPLDIRKKTQGEKNSELKKKTQTQAKNSTFRHFSKMYFYN